MQHLRNVDATPLKFGEMVHVSMGMEAKILGAMKFCIFSHCSSPAAFSHAFTAHSPPFTTSSHVVATHALPLFHVNVTAYTHTHYHTFSHHVITPHSPTPMHLSMFHFLKFPMHVIILFLI